MGDGTWNKIGLVICTENFYFAECLLLISIFVNKFGLNYTLQVINNRPRIYIKSASILHLRSIVCPYFILEILYKLGL
jgi:LAGLIDADG DNA endonuclease family.